MKKKRASSKASLTRFQTFADNVDISIHGISELKSRNNDLVHIWQKYITHQDELEFEDDLEDHSSDRDGFEHLFYKVQAKYLDILASQAIEQGDDGSHSIATVHPWGDLGYSANNEQMFLTWFKVGRCSVGRTLDSVVNKNFTISFCDLKMEMK